MPRFCTATVTAVLQERSGLQRVDTDHGRAYVLTELIGPVAVGDEVVLNTTAVELGLGTGGWHVVHWNLSRAGWDNPSGGHLMKLRYTSLQLDTAPPPPGTGTAAVVACSLHSQVPCVAVAYKHARPAARIAYVMTDGAALPIALSDLVAQLREAQLLDLTVTTGHAFGGDLEATTIAAALGVEADLVIVGMGPGVVGMGDALASTAVEVAHVLDTAVALGHRAVACVRYSDADPRDRHRGMSHHSRAALDLVRETVDVAAPEGVDLDVGRHRLSTVDDVGGPALLAGHGLPVTSIGRGPTEDPAFYAVAGAAGTLAASLGA